MGWTESWDGQNHGTDRIMPSLILADLIQSSALAQPRKGYQVPIELSMPIRVVSQEAFHAIDKVMLGHAFAVHNEFGRLLDEAFYRRQFEVSRHFWPHDDSHQRLEDIATAFWADVGLGRDLSLYR